MKKAARISITSTGTKIVLAALLILALAAGALPGCGAVRSGPREADASDQNDGYCLWLLWVRDDALLKEVQSRLAAGQHFVTISRQIIAAHPKRARQHANCLAQDKIDPVVLKQVRDLDIGEVSKPFGFKDGHALVMRTTERYRQRGHAYFRQRNYAKAEMALLQDLKLHPGSESSWHYVGRARAAQGNLKGAVEALARAQSLAPDKPGNYFYLGLAYQEEGHYRQALSQFRRAADLAPDNPALLSHLAMALMQQSQELSRAESLARRSVGLEPKRAQSWIVLGQVLKARGKKAEAVSAFHRAMLLEPKGSSAGQAMLAVMLQMSPQQVARLYGGSGAVPSPPRQAQKPRPAPAKKATSPRHKKVEPVKKAQHPTPEPKAKPVKPVKPMVTAAAATTTTSTTGTTGTTTEARPFAITTTTLPAPKPAPPTKPAKPAAVKPTTTTVTDGQVARGKIPPMPTVTQAPPTTTTEPPVAATTSTTTTTETPVAATTTTTAPALAATTTTSQKATKPAKPTAKPRFYYLVQVSTNHKESLANRNAEYWRKKGITAIVEVWVSPKGDRWYRVLLGPYKTRAEAIKLGRALKKAKKLKFYRIIKRQVAL